MTANRAGPSRAGRLASTGLVIECDRTWQTQPQTAEPLTAQSLPAQLLPAAGSRERLVGLLGGLIELIPSPLWHACPSPTTPSNRHQPVNALASALLGFLQLPIVKILRTAYLPAMPDYLALYAQARRISASWTRPQGATVMDNKQTYEPTPDWVDAAPFRAHVRALIAETGLPWRIIAAHAEISPRALHTLLHGRRNGQSIRRLHISTARSLAATSVESIDEAATLRTDAGPVRALLHALTRLGVTQAAASGYISADDWHRITQTTTLFCSVATRVQVMACYDLDTAPNSNVTTQQPTGSRGDRPPASHRNVDYGRHQPKLDRKQEAWSPSFSSPTPRGIRW